MIVVEQPSRGLGNKNIFGETPGCLLTWSIALHVVLFINILDTIHLNPEGCKIHRCYRCTRDVHPLV